MSNADTDHPVLRVIRERARRGTTPGSHDDGHTVALAVQGGAVRGVYSSAMLSALEDLGYSQAFDRIYATSSGALNASYFLAGDMWYSLSIYYEDLPSKRFIDFSRMFRGEDLLDMTYVFEELMETEKPLDYQAVLAAPVQFHVAVTDVETVTGQVVSDFTDRDDLKAALLASCWLPVAVRGTTHFRGRQMVDGGVVVKHPVRFALAAEGCTHVMALSTHSPTVRKTVSRRAQMSAKLWMDRLKPGLAEAYLRGMREYEHDRAWMTRASANPQPGPYVLEVAPDEQAPKVRSHESDREKIFAAARSGYATTCRLILGEDVRVVPRLTLAPAPSTPMLC